MRGVYRQAYKMDIWMKSSSTFSILWLIPVVNTIGTITYFLLNISNSPNLPKSKWLNTDL